MFCSLLFFCRLYLFFFRIDLSAFMSTSMYQFLVYPSSNLPLVLLFIHPTWDSVPRVILCFVDEDSSLNYFSISFYFVCSFSFCSFMYMFMHWNGHISLLSFHLGMSSSLEPHWSLCCLILGLISSWTMRYTNGI